MDKLDTQTALWLALGRGYHISLPEFEKLVLLRSGDLMTFDASQVVHSLVGPPVEEGDEEDVEEIQYDDIHCCI